MYFVSLTGQNEGSSGSPRMNTKSKIVVDDVSKEFGAEKSRVQALKNITLSVSEGEFVSIVGPSGCGKSTLYAGRVHLPIVWTIAGRRPTDCRAGD